MLTCPGFLLLRAFNLNDEDTICKLLIILTRIAWQKGRHVQRERARASLMWRCRIMFDELGEEILQSSDLMPRLEAALDGPEAWIYWDIARALARNLIVKLQDPPQKTQRIFGFSRAAQDARAAWDAFPSMPQSRGEGYMDGNRLEDPAVCTFGFGIRWLRGAA